jgi:hypothetical protein
MYLIAISFFLFFSIYTQASPEIDCVAHDWPSLSTCVTNANSSSNPTYVIDLGGNHILTEATIGFNNIITNYLYFCQY